MSDAELRMTTEHIANELLKRDRGFFPRWCGIGLEVHDSAPKKNTDNCETRSTCGTGNKPCSGGANPDTPDDTAFQNETIDTFFEMMKSDSEANNESEVMELQ